MLLLLLQGFCRTTISSYRGCKKNKVAVAVERVPVRRPGRDGSCVATLLSFTLVAMTRLQLISSLPVCVLVALFATKSRKSRKIRFRPRLRIPALPLIFGLAKKVRLSASLLDMIYIIKNNVLTQRVLDETGAKLKPSPSKSPVVQQAQFPITTAWKAAKLHYGCKNKTVIEGGDYKRITYFITGCCG